MHRFAVPGSPVSLQESFLAVQDAGAGAHPLGEPGMDHAAVPLGVLVHEAALSTQVTISMSRWGCVSNPVPGATRSSLLTSSRPNPVLAGS